MGKTVNKIDELWGIERYPSSDLYGKLVCPIILLWARPTLLRKPDDPNRVVAVAEHKTKCKIIARVTIQDIAFYQVEPEHAEWVGKLRRLRGMIQRKEPRGWVSKNFLRGWGVV